MPDQVLDASNMTNVVNILQQICTALNVSLPAELDNTKSPKSRRKRKIKDIDDNDEVQIAKKRVAQSKLETSRNVQELKEKEIKHKLDQKLDQMEKKASALHKVFEDIREFGNKHKVEIEAYVEICQKQIDYEKSELKKINQDEEAKKIEINEKLNNIVTERLRAQEQSHAAINKMKEDYNKKQDEHKQAIKLMQVNEEKIRLQHKTKLQQLIKKEQTEKTNLLKTLEALKESYLFDESQIKSNIDNLKLSIKNKKIEYKNNITEFNNTYKNLQQQVDTMNTNFNKIKIKHQQHMKNMLEKQAQLCMDLTKKNENVQQEKADLQQRFEKIQILENKLSKQDTELKKTKENYEKRLNELKTKIAALQKEEDDINNEQGEVHKKIKDMAQEESELIDKIEHKRAILNQYKAWLAAVEGNTAKLREEEAAIQQALHTTKDACQNNIDDIVKIEKNMELLENDEKNIKIEENIEETKQEDEDTIELDMKPNLEQNEIQDIIPNSGSIAADYGQDSVTTEVECETGHDIEDFTEQHDNEPLTEIKIVSVCHIEEF